MNAIIVNKAPLRITPTGLTNPFLPSNADTIPIRGNNPIIIRKNGPKEPKEIGLNIIPNITKNANKHTKENEVNIIFITSHSFGAFNKYW